MSRSSARSVAALGLGVAVVAAGFSIVSGCGDIGDPNYAGPGVTPLNQVDLENKPFCVGTCAPDYGSTRINCLAEEGLEFFPADILNGGTVGAMPPPTITGFYAYNDGTSDFMMAGPDAFPRGAAVTNDQGSTGVSNYEPDSVLVNDRCGPEGTRAPNLVHHLRGGPFYEWGGGMGRRLLDLVTVNNTTTFTDPDAPRCASNRGAIEGEPDYCPDPDERIEAAADLPGNTALRGQFYSMVVDVRGWEGISFWARQGPDNTAGIRVYVGDRQLDDDIAFIENNAGITPMCGRARECACRDHKPCTRNSDDNNYYCWDPAIDPSPAEASAQRVSAGLPAGNPYDICGTTLCDAQNAAWSLVDPLFATPDNPASRGTAQCQLYKLTNDLESYYCYDANNPASFPPDGPQQCGDGWAKGVALSTDWQFYTIPFTELRQEGYGKEFSYLDLSKITLVRFSWMQGWVDVWLDDVRFYRHATRASQTP